MCVCVCVWSKSLYRVSQRNEAKIKFPANDKNFRSLSFARVVVVVGAGRDESEKEREGDRRQENATKNAAKTRATNDKLRMRGQQQQQQK